MYNQSLYAIDLRCVISESKFIRRKYDLRDFKFATIMNKISDIAESKARFAISTLIVFSIKIASSIFMYSRLSILGNFNTHWMAEWGKIRLPYDWIYLFCAWDTGFYAQIARNWYFYPAYAFFPVYPSLIRILSFITKFHELLSATILSFIFGIACIPAFQILAEEYCNKNRAFVSTMTMAFFPYIFLFTTVAYTESLFLLSTIMTWYFYKKGKLIHSSLIACVSALTKIYGVFILFPILIDIIYNRGFRKILYFSLPVISLLSWLIYLFRTTGDWLIFMSSQSYWINLGMEFNWMRNYLQPLFSYNIWQIPQSDYMIIAFIAIFGYMIFDSFSLDFKLGAYSTFMYLSLLFFGNFHSMPRFFSFIFPVWLNSKLKNPLVLLIMIPFFILISLLMWYHFLLGQWVA